jgi:hypothetical protein
MNTHISFIGFRVAQPSVQHDSAHVRTPAKVKPFIAAASLLILALGVSSCTVDPTFAAFTEPRSLITSIGNSGVVTFAEPTSDDIANAKEAIQSRGARWPGSSDKPLSGELSIPVTVVQTLFNQLDDAGIDKNAGLVLDSAVTVSVYGVDPPTSDEYTLRVRSSEAGSGSFKSLASIKSLSPTSDGTTVSLPLVEIEPRVRSARTTMLDLVLSPSYVARLESMDQLRIHVQVRDAYYDRGKLFGKDTKFQAHDESLRLFEAYAKPLIDDYNKSMKGEHIQRLREDMPVPKWVPDTEKATWLLMATNVQKARKEADEALRESSLSATRSSNAVRVLTVMKATEFRERRLKKSIAIYNINAFPLSSLQTEYLFGKKIERLYYVVGISLQNTAEDNTDKYVNSGMIRLSGQALIQPIEGDHTLARDTWFTVPVSVTPQSREHVYTVLDDEEVDEPRSIFFRSLDFAGTLATAIVTGFNGSEEAIRGLGIATGIGTPELRKFWTDRWPGYKRNVVNYAMPNLIKVGRGTSSPTYFLFFSKTKLEGLVLDSQLFKIDGGESYNPFSRREARITSAAVNVATLSFDSIEIPFELSADENLMKDGPGTQAAVTRAVLDASTDAAKRVEEISTRISRVRSSIAARKDIAELIKTVGPTLIASTDAAAALPKIQTSDRLRSATDAATDNADEARGHASRLANATPASVSSDASSLNSAIRRLLTSLRDADAAAVEVWGITEQKPGSDAQKAALVNLRDSIAKIEQLQTSLGQEFIATAVRTLSTGPGDPDGEEIRLTADLGLAQVALNKANENLRLLTPTATPATPAPTPSPSTNPQ